MHLKTGLTPLNSPIPSQLRAAAIRRFSAYDNLSSAQSLAQSPAKTKSPAISRLLNLAKGEADEAEINYFRIARDLDVDLRSPDVKRALMDEVFRPMYAAEGSGERLLCHG